MTKSSKIGHILAIITIIIWGVTYISTKCLLISFTPVQILFIRFIIGIIALIIACPHILKVKNIKQELVFMGAGLTGVTLYYLLENIALKYTMASNVGVIIAVAPFFTAILTKLIYKNDEKLTVNFFVGFIIAMIGIAFISFADQGDISVNPFGDFLALLAAVVWAFYGIFTKRIGTFGYSTIQTTRRTFIYGTIFMIPAVIYDGFGIKIEELIKPVNLFNILFLGAVACAVCFVTWNYSVKVLGVIKTSIYIYLVPVITVISAIILLGERITLIKGIGVVLAMAGLFISEGNRGSKGKN